MQKFGLDALRTGKATPLEVEIAKEKATSLGLAGKKLEKSLVAYRESVRSKGVGADQEDLLTQIAADISDLLVQREVLGLVHDNLTGILEVYDIPERALLMLGIA